MKRHRRSTFDKHGREQPPESNLPWLHLPSIYSHIVNNLDPATGRLTEAGANLPDDERHYAGQNLRWAPGALDGVLGHHAAATQVDQAARDIVHLIAEIAAVDSNNDKIKLYRLLLDDNVIQFIDRVIEMLAEYDIAVEPYLHQFMRFLAQNATDRGPVKFAIAFLGIIGDPQDKEVISLLGRHEEFTLYSAVALSNMLENAEVDLWELARMVDGWGKIQLVERLSSTQSPAIQSWLLREGYRNSIMHEYLAYQCAVGGNLQAALAAPTIDDQLFEAAGEIIEALINGGPAEGIEDYPDAALVIQDYLRHLEERPQRLHQFVVVDSIRRYLQDEDWDWLERARNGWSKQLYESVLERVDEILGDPTWIEVVQRGLASADNYEFYLANRAATTLGLDTWAVHWERLQRDPVDEHRWYLVMQHARPDIIEQITTFAATVLPLEDIASGPADEMGLSAEHKPHRCLDYILQGLREYRTAGWPLIAAGLKSPVIRNRNMALRALAAWGREHWTREIENALEQARLAEPEADVKERIEKVIRGEPFE